MIRSADARHSAFIGIGANLGDPLATLRLAVGELRRLPGSEVAGVSSVYRSAPVGVSEVQPDYLNAVVRLRTDLAPDLLLGRLQEIEQLHGRRRDGRNQPRTLDLDLLLYDDMTTSTTSLALPHPRMHERAFVLEPLAEIAPDTIIPGRGSARSLLPGTAGQRIERLTERV
jgi:2-amino-4-hydroxy-6-hydroxymethyldihydropteridine diphosphokinase